MRIARQLRTGSVLPILIDRWGLKKESIWYPYADKTVKALDSTIRVAFGNHLARRLMR